MAIPRRMVVEGGDDRHSVIGLMRAYIEWPEQPSDWPVFIDLGRSADEILSEGYLTAQLKTPGLEMLGVIVDADDSAAGRYQRLRQLCSVMFPGMPMELPVDGLIVQNEEQKTLGVWIMPDNRSAGSLEIFLLQFVPFKDAAVWKHAQHAVESARTLGAPCRESHVEKATLYTWLAWQDPPGQYPGLALTRKVLDPHSVSAAPFVRWFRELYRL